MLTPQEKAQRQARYRQRVQAGLCARCGHLPARPDLKTCQPCQDRAHAERAAVAVKSRGARKTEARQCLRCDRTFRSEGPQNRLCPACQNALAQTPPGLDPRPLPSVVRVWPS
jgi:hypothetical protein